MRKFFKGGESSGKISLLVAGLQMNVTRDIELNKRTIIENLRVAAGAGAEILVLPEGALSGYHNEFDAQELNEALAEVETAVADFKIGLFLGTCLYEAEGEALKCFNQVRVYSPEGALCGKQSKILLCSPIDRPGTGEMIDYAGGKLELIRWKGVNIGILICNDLWATPGFTTIENPYLPLKLKELGANVIFHSINSGYNQRCRTFHETSAELWANALGIPILEVNAAKETNEINAQSGLIDRNGDRTVRVPVVGEQLFYCNIEISDEAN
ncbi:carbon-nitrogen hydrolase family protein [Puniceicoccaceae bacterium K14]|nr:carbon-nitrogen hydrolase family protein [Puniceicoccaceae bacterium K14]